MLKNVLLYGTQDPLEALNVLRGDNSKYLLGVHAKDASRNDENAEYGKTEGDWKGGERVMGLGAVKFQETMRILHGLGYNGPVIIEREGNLPGIEDEIRADQRIGEVKDAVGLLRRAETYALANIPSGSVPFK